MLAAPYNFVIQQGSTFDPVWTWKAGGTLVNLTGYGARMQGRSTLDGEVILNFSTDEGNILLGGAAGTTQPILTASETAQIQWHEGLKKILLDENDKPYPRPIYQLAEYDFEYFIGDWVGRRMEGYFLLSREATR